ncbi:fractalkine [Eublepharis macularius]|uniref:Fractalkine n=1 Tax=Eublepharis macularius TaxID=481883 RepID=A0AA97LIB2_EUBMA|nr:fractalkine [Eublepharis macularius]
MRSAGRGARLLLVAPWIWGAILAALGQPMGSQVCEKGCAKFHRPIPLNLLQSYEKRECGKPVVFVTTKRNRTICTNPKDQWVQDAMRALDAKSATPTVMAKPGEFDKHFGNTARMSTQAGRAVYPTETFGTAAYGKSTPSVTMTTEDPKPSAENSVSAWAQTAKSSTGSTSKPELIVSGTTVQPEPFTNGSAASYFTDRPEASGKGLTPVGKGLEDTSGSAREMVPPTFLGTPSHSDFHTKHVEKSSGEATTPSPEVPPDFWSNALVEHRSYIISLVFLGLALGFSLATAWVYAKHRRYSRAATTEMARRVKFSNDDSQTGAHVMQVL